jgi:hypothetical protein
VYINSLEQSGIVSIDVLEQRGRDLRGPSRRTCGKVELVEVTNTSSHSDYDTGRPSVK